MYVYVCVRLILNRADGQPSQGKWYLNKKRLEGGKRAMWLPGRENPVQRPWGRHSWMRARRAVWQGLGLRSDPGHEGRSFRSGVPKLWHLVSDDLRQSWCNNNGNTVQNKRNVLESSWNHPLLSTSHPSCGKIVFHEVSPCCWKDWGPLAYGIIARCRDFDLDSESTEANEE